MEPSLSFVSCLMIFRGLEIPLSMEVYGSIVFHGCVQGIEKRLALSVGE